MRSPSCSVLASIIAFSLCLLSSPSTAAVIPPSLTSLSLNPTSVIGGTSSTGTVTLTGPVPANGLVVSLSSSSTAATVPASVTVPSGATTATFTINTSPVSANPNVVPPGASVVISASHYIGGAGAIALTPRTLVTKTAQLTVLTPLVTSLGIFGPITGGQGTAGLVRLTGPAPSGGAVVHLSSSNTGVATVPDSVTALAGANGQGFQVTTHPVAASTSVTISAHRGVFDAKTATVTVLPPALWHLEASPNSVTGGTSATGKAFLTGPVASGASVVIALSSTNPAVVVPGNVTVVAGGAWNAAPFGVTTNPVPSSTSATISASYAGITQTTSMTVLPPALSSFTCNPTSVTGGNAVACTVKITGPAPLAGVNVHLSSSNSVVAPVPASVPVVGGANSTNFTIPTNPVGSSTSVALSASSGGVTKTATLTVNPVPPASLSRVLLGGTTAYSLITPPPDAGISVGGYVELTGKAPQGGADVNITYSGPVNFQTSAVVGIPDYPVHILEGATGAQFPFMIYKCPSYASDVACDGKVKATYKGVSREAYIKVPN
jgi:hypothetical protein